MSFFVVTEMLIREVPLYSYLLQFIQLFNCQDRSDFRSIERVRLIFLIYIGITMLYILYISL